MNAQDLEQRARELLAEAERGPMNDYGTVHRQIAHRAIVAALRQQPAPVDLEQFREAVRAMDDFIFHRERCGFPHQICDCGMKEARDRLLSIIDNAGKACGLYRCVECDDHYRVGTPCDCKSQPKPAPVVDDARMARALEWVRTAARGNVGEGDALRVALVESARKHLPAIEEAIAAYDPACGARTVRVVDDELPGMWSQSDFMGGAADAADDARQLVPSVDDATVDRYLAAQAKAVQEIDDAWGNGGKAASYLHPVREACRAGLTAALARAQGLKS